MHLFITFQSMIPYLALLLVLIIGSLYYTYRHSWMSKAPAVKMASQDGLLMCHKCRASSFTVKDEKLMCYICKTMYVSHGPFGLEEYKKRDIHNPYGLAAGDDAWLDYAMYKEPVRVKIVKMSPRNIYSEVTDGREKWEVMTNRLALPKFYCTFGQDHTLRGVKLRDGWIEIFAKTASDAKAHIERFVDNKYSMIYSEINDVRFYPEGCLAQMTIYY